MQSRTQPQEMVPPTVDGFTHLNQSGQETHTQVCPDVHLLGDLIKTVEINHCSSSPCQPIASLSANTFHLPSLNCHVYPIVQNRTQLQMSPQSLTVPPMKTSKVLASFETRGESLSC